MKLLCNQPDGYCSILARLMTKKDLKALQLLSAFSLPPNSLDYCGRESAGLVFRQCIVDGRCDQVRTEVEAFIVLWPYLKTIGEVTNKDPFSYEVVEAYWFGNRLLHRFTHEHYSVLLHNLKTQGVPGFLLNEIKTKIPKQFVPIHLFNILHVGVGKASGAVPFNLESINNCMIRWGKIVSINKPEIVTSRRMNGQRRGGPGEKDCMPTVTIKLNSLKIVGERYKFQLLNETVFYDPVLTPSLRLGQTAAAHWGLVCKSLNSTEETNLAYWTTKLVNTL